MSFDRRKLGDFNAESLGADLRQIVDSSLSDTEANIGHVEQRIIQQIVNTFAEHREGVAPSEEDRAKIREVVKVSLQELFASPREGTSKSLEFPDESLNQIADLLLLSDARTLKYQEHLKRNDRVDIGSRGAFSVIAVLLEQDDYVSTESIAEQTGFSPVTVEQTHIKKSNYLLEKFLSDWVIVGNKNRGWKLRKGNSE